MSMKWRPFCCLNRSRQSVTIASVSSAPTARRGADCAVHQQTEERAVTAAVVERPRAGDVAGQTQTGGKPSSMTPRDEARAAVDLLLRVEAGAYGFEKDAHAAACCGACAGFAPRRVGEGPMQFAKGPLAAPLAAHVLAASTSLLARRVRIGGDAQQRLRHRAGITSRRERRVVTEVRRHAADRGRHDRDFAGQRFERREPETFLERTLHQRHRPRAGSRRARSSGAPPAARAPTALNRGCPSTARAR